MRVRIPSYNKIPTCVAMVVCDKGARALFTRNTLSRDRFPVYAISVLFVLAMIGYLSRLSDSDLASTLQYDCYSR